MDNELIVLRACGVDQYALARPAVILAISISLMITGMTMWVSPKCAGEVQTLRQLVKTQYSAFLLREGVFNTFGSNLTVYLRAREKNGDLTGLMIHDTRDKKKPAVTIIAKRGRVVMEGDIPNIIVFEGMRQQPDAATGTLSKLYFARYTIEVNGLDGTAQVRWRDAKERTFGELLNPDLTNKRDTANQGIFLAEANNRIISPWNALSFTLIALMPMLLGSFNRRGQSKKILFAAILVAVVQTFNLTFANLSKKHGVFIPLLYLNTLLPILLGAWFLHLKGEQQLISLVRRWNARFVQKAAA